MGSSSLSIYWKILTVKGDLRSAFIAHCKIRSKFHSKLAKRGKLKDPHWDTALPTASIRLIHLCAHLSLTLLTAPAVTSLFASTLNARYDNHWPLDEPVFHCGSGHSGQGTGWADHCMKNTRYREAWLLLSPRLCVSLFMLFYYGCHRECSLRYLSYRLSVLQRYGTCPLWRQLPLGTIRISYYMIQCKKMDLHQFTKYYFWMPPGWVLTLQTVVHSLTCNGWLISRHLPCAWWNKWPTSDL